MSYKNLYVLCAPITKCNKLNGRNSYKNKIPINIHKYNCFVFFGSTNSIYLLIIV